MPRLVVPNSVTIQNAHAFLEANRAFDERGRRAVLQLHPRWTHLDPMGLAMIAAWGAWCQRRGFEIEVQNAGRHTRYAARMKLFECLRPAISGRSKAS